MGEIRFEEDADLATTPTASDEDLHKIADLAAEQVRLADEVEQAEKELKRLKRELQAIEMSSLPLAMEAVGLKEITLKDGSKVTIKEDLYASITQKKKDEAHEWLRENGFGDLIKEITREQVHPQTLKAFIREQVSQGRDIPLETFGIGFYQKAVIKKR